MTKEEAKRIVQELLWAEEAFIISVANGYPEDMQYRCYTDRNALRDRIIAALCSGPTKDDTHADTENA